MEPEDSKKYFQSYRALRYLLAFGRLIGLGTFPMQRHGSMEEVPKLVVAYSITVCLVCVVMLFILLVLMFESGRTIAKREEEKIFNVYILLTGWSACAVTAIECQVNFFFRRRRIHDLIVKMAEIPTAKDSEKMARSSRTSIMINCSFIAILVSFIAFASYTQQIPLDLTVAVSSEAYLTVAAISRLTMVAILHVIRSQFRNINEQIMTIGEDTLWARAVENKEIIRNGSSLSMSEAAVCKVRQLASDHFQLTEYCSQWASLFGFNCVMISVNTFFSVVCFGYTTVGKPLNLVHMNNLEIEILCAFGWTIITVMGFVSVVNSCSDVAAEANQTGRVISTALLNINDEQLQVKLKDFSVQLLHSKVNFTACDLFSIEKSLFTSMGATIVTYFVIIIQFQMADVPDAPTDSVGNETFVS
ncbi:putative gustatory receptor 28b [Ischnura elegans]|uniref:putative gustatory receptor 28b n=1 Tax=Ischnura elegans TaxID=197161 RepID=UPI001ED87610|nr:putative gustatory receptor 28b [Ischnura elegans]